MSVLLLFVISACMLLVPEVTLVRGAAGDVIWAKSEIISSYGDIATGVAVDGTGMYVVGSDYNGSAGSFSEWRIEKRNLATGEFVLSFGSAGAISEHIGSFSDAASAVAVDGSGLYVGGYDTNTTGGQTECRIEKRDLSTGAFIVGFGSGGAISEHGCYSVSGVAVDGTGLYLVGSDDNTPTNNSEWRIEKRSLTTGAMIWSQSEHISSASDGADGVAVDGTGVYVVGSDENTPSNNAEWRIEKRGLTTGDIIWSRSEHLSTGSDLGWAASVDGTGLYAVGIDRNTTDARSEWRIEKRDLSTGMLVAGFGSGGAISEHISSTDDLAAGVAVDGTGLYVVGADAKGNLGYREWRIEKRDLSTGRFVTGFGSGGAVSEQISKSANGDIAYGVAIDGTGVYVVGFDGKAPGDNAEWRMEKRDSGVPPPTMPGYLSDALIVIAILMIVAYVLIKRTKSRRAI